MRQEHISTRDVGQIEFPTSSYAGLVAFWMNRNCAEFNWCNAADLNMSGKVDCHDWAEFIDCWLINSD